MLPQFSRCKEGEDIPQTMGDLEDDGRLTAYVDFCTTWGLHRGWLMAYAGLAPAIRKAWKGLLQEPEAHLLNQALPYMGGEGNLINHYALLLPKTATRMGTPVLH
ncbi:hypothetical protein NDU88_001400, partial [Pleurodeles waltl]